VSEPKIILCPQVLAWLREQRVPDEEATPTLDVVLHTEHGEIARVSGSVDADGARSIVIKIPFS
jgi:hypothetical protein